MTKFTLLLALFLGLSLVAAKNLYGDNRDHVTPLNKGSWDKVITKARTRLVSIVHFYRSEDGVSRDYAKKFKAESTAKEGIFKFAAVDCDEHYDLCDKEGITKYPTIRVFPPLPVPPYDVEADVAPEKVTAQAAKYVPSNVIKINAANIDTFISDSPSVPKVLLFTDKTGIPVLFRALSKAFEKKLFFGLIHSSEEGLMGRYNVKKTPQIIVVKLSDKKPHVYSGEMNYPRIFEFLNIYSETFVAGGGSSQDTAATKAWLTEIVPELTSQSAKDICIGQDNVLCVILLSEGKPSKELIDQLKGAHQMSVRKIERGVKYNFMWLDTAVEKDFAGVFKVPQQPAVVILNPGRRKRYAVHPGDIQEDSLKSTFEKIAGGDMKFTNIKSLPELKTR